MSNNRLGIYPEDDAREIHKRVLGHSLPLQELGQAKQHTFHNMLYYAVLTEDLAPATNATTGYTSAECRVLRYVQPIDSTTLNMESATGDISLQTITNRYTTFSASIGDVLLIIRNGAEWSPVAAVGSSSSQRHAMIIECLGGGYYTALMAATPEFSLPSEIGTGTGTGGTFGCSMCDLIVGENEPGTGSAGNVGPVECGSLVAPSRYVPTGTGDLIYCYDPRLLTLPVSAHVIISDLGDRLTVTGTGTGTGTANTGEVLWMVLTGNYNLVAIPDRFYECCDGVVTLTRCDNYIVEGVFCQGNQIDCPGTGTGSA
jgi:hypothetical protein